MRNDAALVTWLSDDIEAGTEKVREETLKAMAKLGWGDESAAYLKNLQKEGPESLRPQAEKAYKRLIARLESQTTEGRKSLHWQECLSHMEPALRARGLFELAQAEKCPENAGKAIARVKEEDDPWLQSIAIYALSIVGDKENQDTLLRVLSTARHGRLQAEAVDGLARLEPETGGELAEGLLDHRDFRVRRAALRALVAVDVDKAIELLNKMLRSLKQNIREAAIFSLSSIDDDRVTELALHALEQENDRALMEQEAAILWSRAPKDAIGAIGFLRRSMDSRVAEITSALYDHLLKVHQPTPAEIEELEESFLEKRRARLAKNVPPHGPAAPAIEEEEEERTHIPKWVNVAIFTSLVIIFITLVISQIIKRLEPQECLIPQGQVQLQPTPQNEHWRTLLGSGGTFSGRVKIIRIIEAHRQLELLGPSQVHITLHLQSEVPQWAKEGMTCQAIGSRGTASPTGRLFLEEGKIEKVP